jgi:hypothetical protein
MSSENSSNRIFNSMSDQPRPPAPAAQTSPPTELTDVQRRRADVIDVLAETLVDLLLKRPQPPRGGTAR